MNEDDDVVRFLKEALTKEETILGAMEREIEPQREKVRRLRASLGAAQAGTFGSSAVTDAEIIEHLRAGSKKGSPLSTSEVGKGLNLDARGLSRRLQRMAREELISGGPRSGYWVE